MTAGGLPAAADAVLGRRSFRLLSPGVYQARKLHLLWTRPTGPTDIAGVSRLYDVFDEVAKGIVGPEGRPHRRIYLSRKGAPDERIPAADRDALGALLDRAGFEVLDPAEMPFVEQVRAAAQAQIILAPHGAAMANLLFSPRETLVIELTSRLGGETSYRPWYYQLCDGRGQPYAAIDVGRSGWLDDLAAALRTRPRPLSQRIAHRWSRIYGR